MPRAKLLLEDRCTHEPESHERLRSGFAAQGVDAARVQFIPYLAGHERHMRVSGAALTAMDRPEWIAPDAAGFAAMVQAVAGRLAGEAAARNRQRRAQRVRMAASPLGDAVSLTRALESALAAMYERWLQSGTSAAEKPL